MQAVFRQYLLERNPRLVLTAKGNDQIRLIFRNRDLAKRNRLLIFRR